jgi:hypothetical protein
VNVLKKLVGPAVVAALFAGASSTPAIAMEAIGVLNDTGQTSCYDIDYNAIPCDEAGTGDDSPLPRQDGRYGRDAGAAMGNLVKIGGGEAGFDYTRLCMSGEEEGQGDCPSPPPLPTDLENPQPNDWACLRDNVTGLTWTLGNWNVDVNWATASSTADGSEIQLANASARCGSSSGWRVPARREGYSLLNVQRQLPAVDPAYFPILVDSPSVFSGVWTSDRTAWHSEFQWVIGFGSVATLSGMQCRELAPVPPCDSYPGDTTDFTASVLLVNGSWRQPPTPEPPEGKSKKGEERWQIRDDGLTVTDSATGLTWDRCGWGQVGSTCVGQPTIFYDWNEAMQVARIANEQRYKGFYDWRVPNVRELETLVKIDGNPAIDLNVFPHTLIADDYSYYLTSSQNEVVPGAASYVWFVEFVLGTSSATAKVNYLPDEYPNVGAIRLVRGGSGWESFDGVSDRLFWSDFDGPPAPASTH